MKTRFLAFYISGLGFALFLGASGALAREVKWPRYIYLSSANNRLVIWKQHLPKGILKWAKSECALRQANQGREAAPGESFQAHIPKKLEKTLQVPNLWALTEKGRVSLEIMLPGYLSGVETMEGYSWGCEQLPIYFDIKTNVISSAVVTSDPEAILVPQKEIVPPTSMSDWLKHNREKANYSAEVSSWDVNHSGLQTVLNANSARNISDSHFLYLKSGESSFVEFKVPRKDCTKVGGADAQLVQVVVNRPQKRLDAIVLCSSERENPPWVRVYSYLQGKWSEGLEIPFQQIANPL